MVSLKDSLFEKITVAVSLGFNIINVEKELFIYKKFDSSTSASTGSTDFCSFSGVCVTEFFVNEQIGHLRGSQEFKSKLESIIDNSSIINVKFNKNMEYMTFSS